MARKLRTFWSRWTRGSWTMTKAVPSAEFTAACKTAEFYETPRWAAERILDFELLTPLVIDPCAGRGVLGDALIAKGYDPSNIIETDLNDWPGRADRIISGVDFLNPQACQSEISKRGWHGQDFSVIMNPPFSKACDFLIQAFELGARKVLMFQRFSFMESRDRREFWDEMAPSRIWLCGDRAHCWRGDMPDEDIFDADGTLLAKGKKGRSSPTAHAWYVWEKGHASAPITRIYKE